MKQEEILNLLEKSNYSRDKYKDLIQFKNNEPGFSIKREYDESLLFKPAKNHLDKSDDVCLLKIIYQNWDDINDKDYYYFLASATKFSKYISNKPYYNYLDLECPTPQSTKISNESPQPQDISLNFKIRKKDNMIMIGTNTYTFQELFDKLYYNHTYKVTKEFFDAQNKQIKLSNLLTSPLRSIRNLLTNILKFNFGRIIIEKINEKEDSKGNKKLELIQYSKEVKLFEYETSAISIFTFTLYLSILYNLYHLSFTKYYLIENILNNNALILIFGINLLISYDFFLPLIILNIIKMIDKISNVIRNKNVKF
ncbi:hypothetical protein [Leptospira mtsangambouensis]|uniref:hypothetical protein n=1 Tax=Leptospira mtsangambouensis TaxID=2484912 RepID=UPI001EEC5157|nr:hypothetical protein [Leptospira mtsangambouensis]MCG6142833.1 hypothetical protein [Leptospira mtsangambouensis]